MSRWGLLLCCSRPRRCCKLLLLCHVHVTWHSSHVLLAARPKASMLMTCFGCSSSSLVEATLPPCARFTAVTRDVGSHQTCLCCHYWAEQCLLGSRRQTPAAAPAGVHAGPWGTQTSSSRADWWRRSPTSLAWSSAPAPTPSFCWAGAPVATHPLLCPHTAFPLFRRLSFVDYAHQPVAAAGLQRLARRTANLQLGRAKLDLDSGRMAGAPAAAQDLKQRSGLLLHSQSCSAFVPGWPRLGPLLQRPPLLSPPILRAAMACLSS